MLIKAIKSVKKSIIKNLTSFGRNPKIPKTREVPTPTTREVKKPFDSAQGKPASDSLKCPYCLSAEFFRRGFRQKKREKVQLYQCKTCHKTFTSHLAKGKHYPLAVIFDALSLYHLGYSMEKVCEIINKDQMAISASVLAVWLAEFKDLCKFSRMREFALKKYSPGEMVIYATLAHQQLFRYRFHQAKCKLIMEEDFKHYRFGPLKEFLEMVPVECPHQFFSTGLRASEAPLTFSKTQMIVRAKQNHANELAQFVLQSVKERRRRHEALQKFMLYNDSVTVATEVPVYLTRDDLLHMQTQLGFELYNRQNTSEESDVSLRSTLPPSEVSVGALPKLITGHIDVLQVRNGQIHILDYKPKAEKNRPIEQLTLYAMALSRLTGLRMFDFKCAWFDENDYFEFYPLHVLYKPKRKRPRRKIQTSEGVYLINKIKEKIEKIRPI